MAGVGQDEERENVAGGGLLCCSRLEVDTEQTSKEVKREVVRTCSNLTAAH